MDIPKSTELFGIFLTNIRHVKKNKIEVKIRIPETPTGQSRLNAIWNQIVDKVSRMNGRAFALSSNKAEDPYFYVIEGTRIKH